MTGQRILLQGAVQVSLWIAYKGQDLSKACQGVAEQSTVGNEQARDWISLRVAIKTPVSDVMHLLEGMVPIGIRCLPLTEVEVAASLRNLWITRFFQIPKVGLQIVLGIAVEDDRTLVQRRHFLIRHALVRFYETAFPQRLVGKALVRRGSRTVHVRAGPLRRRSLHVDRL